MTPEEQLIRLRFATHVVKDDRKVDQVVPVYITPEERLISVEQNAKKLLDALKTLDNSGIRIDESFAEFTRLHEEAARYVPKDYPEAYRIRATARSITEHLTENRDMLPVNLHSPSSNGRIYKLTPAQRSVLAERYGMTPTTEVIVSEIDVWPAAPTCVRSITIKSTEHVPEHRRHILSACVITDWVNFCRAVETRTANDLVIKERERLSARLDRLWDRAAKSGVTPTIKPGKILTRWWAAIDAIPVTDDRPQAIRDSLREILLEHGEHDLAKLVKEPAYFIDDETPRSEKRAAAEQTFKDLLSQYL